LWVLLNSFILVRRGASFDPYPYILLNLFLSMLAAVQAPVILMSQSRVVAYFPLCSMPLFSAHG